MRVAGIDAVIAWSPSNVRYLTGYWCWLDPVFREFMVQPGGSGAIAQRSYALLPCDGRPCLVVEPLWAVNAPDTWVEDVRTPGQVQVAPPAAGHALPGDLARILGAITRPDAPADALSVLAEAVVERGLGSSRIGIELEGLPAHLSEALASRLPRAELVDCTNLLRLVRAVKTTGEIVQLARAAEIAESAALAALAAAVPGSPVSAPAQVFRRHLAGEGADVDHFTFGLYGLGIVTGGEQPLPDGQALYFDFGCIYDGWFSDSGTTFCLGEPTAEALEGHAAAVASVDAGAAVIRPGARGSAVQAAMQEALAERGIVASYPHGHGLGLDVRDYPILVPDNGGVIRDGCIEVASDLPLEPNMVINLEAPVFVPGLHSVHCERTFVVTENGARPLVPQDRAAPVVGLAREKAR
jgi:Xaa-Pro aminopeptidase